MPEPPARKDKRRVIFLSVAGIRDQASVISVLQ